MAHKKQRHIPSTHPRQKILAELNKVKEEGIKFPEHNPLPKRKIEMKKSEKKTHNLLRYKEWLRTNTKPKNFTGWEYADRYTYRKVNSNEN